MHTSHLHLAKKCRNLFFKCLYFLYVNLSRHIWNTNTRIVDHPVIVSPRTVGFLAFTACCLFFHVGTSSSAMAGQNITVTDIVSHGIYGNGDLANGELTDDDTDYLLSPNHNTVTIAGGGTDQYYGVVGGLSFSQLGAAVSTGNRVYIEEGSAISGSIYGARAFTGGNNGLVEYNSVTVRGGRVERAIFGGHTDTYLINNSSGSLISRYNTVMVSGGTVSSITGGYAGAGSTSHNVDAQAENNTVIISGGSVSGRIAGGYSYSGVAAASASGNSVLVSGGNCDTSASELVGGYAYSNSGTASATNNTVTLSGSAVFSTNSTILGGKALVGGVANGDAFTGNTLNINGFSGSLAEVGNFENYNFLVSSTSLSSGAILSISGAKATDLANTHVTVTGVENGAPLAVGSSVTLIDKTLNSPVAFNGETVRQGALIEYDFTYDANITNALVVSVRSIRAATPAKSISEGRAASLAFVRQGQDLLVDSGFAAADAYLGRTGDGWSTPAFFGAVGGGHFRHKTGSHVNIDGVSTLLGLTWRNNGPCGSLLLGAFFEAGYADYDTHNAFASVTVRGNGDSRYFGGGFLARYDWQSGLYVEASGRAGGIKNKFHSDLADLSGNRVKYDINSPYFGAHAGIGYKWQMNEKAVLDLSAKYLWSRQNSDSAVVTGSHVDFAATNSHRVRTGARFSYSMNDCFAPYLGAAFEYEFNGKARGSVSNYNFGVPSLKGGTGIGEIGLIMRRSNFSADLGIQGHVGRRDGVTGNLRIGWTF